MRKEKDAKEAGGGIYRIFRFFAGLFRGRSNVAQYDAAFSSSQQYTVRKLERGQG
jgi:hypothetical protein